MRLKTIRLLIGSVALLVVSATVLTASGCRAAKPDFSTVAKMHANWMSTKIRQHHYTVIDSPETQRLLEGMVHRILAAAGNQERQVTTYIIAGSPNGVNAILS